MNDWLRGIRQMLRLKLPESRPEDEDTEREKIIRAKARLKILDIQADIIARRSGKVHP
jgi:hypothetical protein